MDSPWRSWPFSGGPQGGEVVRVPEMARDRRLSTGMSVVQLVHLVFLACLECNVRSGTKSYRLKTKEHACLQNRTPVDR